MTTVQTYNKNIKLVYSYSFFMAFLVCIPVIVPYWKSYGLTISQIFTLQGIFGAALIIFDLPAGYVADLFGRKKTMLVGSIVSALGYMILWQGTTYTHFIFFEIVVGIGMSLQSGCDVAVLFNSAELAGRKNEVGQFLSRRLSIQNISEGTASLLAAALTTFSLSLPFMVNAITPWFMVLSAFLIQEPPTEKMSRDSHLKNFKLIGKALFGHSKLLTWVIISFVVYSFATYCAVWSMQPYWLEKGIKPEFFGLLWAANSFATAFIGFFAKTIERKMGSTGTILLITVTPIIGYLGLGWTGGLLGLVFAIFFPICRGLNGVLFQEALNNRIPNEIRATANSIGSLGMRAMFLIFGPLLGWMMDNYGPSEAMKLMGYIYIGLFIVIAWPLLKLRHHFKIH